MNEWIFIYNFRGNSALKATIEPDTYHHPQKNHSIYLFGHIPVFLRGRNMLWLLLTQVAVHSELVRKKLTAFKLL